MNKIILFSVLAAAGTVAACASNGSKTAEYQAQSSNSNVSFGVYDIASSGPSSLSQSNSVAQPAESRTMAVTSGGGGGGGRPEIQNIPQDKVSLTQAFASQTDPSNIDRKIIRNGELYIECEQPDDAQKRIALIAQTNGGFIVESQQSTSDVKLNTRDIVHLIVRVPANKFAETVDQIKTASGRIIQETVKGDDVTEEFIDIDARLKAKKALEQQFIEIMKRANTVDDALSVQSQLAEVRGEIEKIEGRRRFLENQSSLSTIKIKLQTPMVFAANSSGFSHRLGESFATGFDFALNFVLGLVTLVVAILPFAAFIGLPVFFGFRYFWKKQGLPKSVSEIAKEELKVT